jgi:hypothetical protein
MKPRNLAKPILFASRSGFAAFQQHGGVCRADEGRFPGFF